MSPEDTEYTDVVRTLSDRVVLAQGPIRVLDAVKWDDSVKQRFFAAKCGRQPEVDAGYCARRPLSLEVDTSRRVLEAIDRDVEEWLDTDDPAGRPIRRMCREYEGVLSMLDAQGTADFHRLSGELYGRSEDPFHEGGPTLVELAALLDGVLQNLDADAFGETQPAEIEAPEGAAESVVMVFSHVAETEKQAREIAAPAMARFLQALVGAAPADPEDLYERMLERGTGLFGAVEQVAKQIARHAEIGVAQRGIVDLREHDRDSRRWGCVRRCASRGSRPRERP